MNEKQYIIWSNREEEDWMEEYIKMYPDCSESECREIIAEDNANNLQDERENLNIQLSQSILVIGDLGLWNGRKPGYKEIKTGNIRDCLYDEADYVTWFVDSLGDFRAIASDHDGTNYYLYRVYKDTATAEQRERLKDKIYSGTVKRPDITRVTRRLGDNIARVYGFSIPRLKGGTA